MFHQFPVTMAYAITDYKCQSLTFEQVVVDLKCPSTGFAPAAARICSTLSMQSAQLDLYHTPLRSIPPYHEIVQGIIGRAEMGGRDGSQDTSNIRPTNQRTPRAAVG